MNRDSFYPAIACFPLLLMLAGCAPMHETRQALSQQTPAAQVDTALPTALKNGWPDSQWWLEYHDNQLTSLINNALQSAPDMQVAEQRIQLAEAQAKAVATQDGPQLDFSSTGSAPWEQASREWESLSSSLYLRAACLRPFGIMEASIS